MLKISQIKAISYSFTIDHRSNEMIIDLHYFSILGEDIIIDPFLKEHLIQIGHLQIKIPYR